MTLSRLGWVPHSFPSNRHRYSLLARKLVWLLYPAFVKLLIYSELFPSHDFVQLLRRLCLLHNKGSKEISYHLVSSKERQACEGCQSCNIMEICFSIRLTFPLGQEPVKRPYWNAMLLQNIFSLPCWLMRSLTNLVCLRSSKRVLHEEDSSRYESWIHLLHI